MDELAFAKHLEAISAQLVEVVKRIDHLDACFDRHKDEMRDQFLAHIRTVGLLLDAAKATLAAEVKAVDARTSFADWAVKLIVGAIVLGFLAAAGAVIFKAGQESQRSFTLPTTPYKEPGK